ncbi:MAG: hypothetical protein KME31_32885 [Tolypothrix carrinoi HA7290-LM1]|jgi:hypothetical protein|nr:hypothetical protein [Tolypothrix carrinoi HA7290-LM1]
MGAVPELTGVVPQLTGTPPELMGVVPKLTGAVPELMGAVPELMGAVPELMGAVPELMGAVSQLTGAVSQLTGAVPELMGAVYLATLVINTQFVSTHYLTLMTVNGKACHNYCRETKQLKPMTSINISLPDSFQAFFCCSCRICSISAKISSTVGSPKI